MFDGVQFVSQIRAWARELGFSQIGVAGVDLRDAEPGLLAWLQAGFHGEMAYMASHGLKRARPQELLPGTLSVVTASMDYLPRQRGSDWCEQEWARLRRPQEAVISMYARGRDYHKVLRQRLQKLAERMQQALDAHGQSDGFTYRAFTDSAPVMEVELAQRSGIGWRGKHTLALRRDGGSLFFLGEIFVNVALIFTAFMHALQMVMLKNGLPKDSPPMTGWQQLRVFIFGVFELLVWMKKFKAQTKK